MTKPPGGGARAHVITQGGKPQTPSQKELPPSRLVRRLLQGTRGRPRASGGSDLPARPDGRWTPGSPASSPTHPRRLLRRMADASQSLLCPLSRPLHVSATVSAPAGVNKCEMELQGQLQWANQSSGSYFYAKPPLRFQRLNVSRAI